MYRGVGTVYERRGVRWLRKAGFTNIQSFPKRHNHPFDVTAERGREYWVIEIKGGEKPGVRIRNLLKMYSKPGVTKLGLLFVVEGDEPLLFELKKMSRAGYKAARRRAFIAGNSS